jgi:hypothetical protein
MALDGRKRPLTAASSPHQYIGLGTSQPPNLVIAESPSGDATKPTFSIPRVGGNGIGSMNHPNPEITNVPRWESRHAGMVQGDAEPVPTTDNARPEEQEGEAALNRIVLTSRLSRTPKFSPWLLATCSIAVTSFTVYYGRNASFSSTLQNGSYGINQITPFSP